MSCNCFQFKKEKDFNPIIIFMKSILAGMFLILGLLLYNYTITFQSGISKLFGALLFGGFMTIIIRNDYDLLCCQLLSLFITNDNNNIYYYLHNKSNVKKLIKILMSIQYLLIIFAGNLLGALSVFKCFIRYMNIPEINSEMEILANAFSNLSIPSILLKSFLAGLIIAYAYIMNKENNRSWYMIVPLSLIVLFSLTPIVNYIVLILSGFQNIVYSPLKFLVCLGGNILGFFACSSFHNLLENSK